MNTNSFTDLTPTQEAVLIQQQMNAEMAAFTARCKPTAPDAPPTPQVVREAARGRRASGVIFDDIANDDHSPVAADRLNALYDELQLLLHPLPTWGLSPTLNQTWGLYS